MLCITVSDLRDFDNYIIIMRLTFLSASHSLHDIVTS